MSRMFLISMIVIYIDIFNRKGEFISQRFDDGMLIDRRSIRTSRRCAAPEKFKRLERWYKEKKEGEEEERKYILDFTMAPR